MAKADIKIVVAVRKKDGEYFVYPPCGLCREFLLTYYPDAEVAVSEGKRWSLRHYCQTHGKKLNHFKGWRSLCRLWTIGIFLVQYSYMEAIDWKPIYKNIMVSGSLWTMTRLLLLRVERRLLKHWRPLNRLVKKNPFWHKCPRSF